MQSAHENSGGDRRNRRWSVVAGIVMVSMGLLLLIAVGLYYSYGFFARSQLDALNFTVEPDTSLVPVSVESPSGADRPEQTAQLSTAPDTGHELPKPPTQPRTDAATPLASVPEASPAAEGPELASFPASSYASMYPGVQMHPKHWGQPLWAGGEPYSYSPGNSGPILPDGFRAISTASDVLARGESANATRITVPAIGVDSGTKELEVIDLGDSSAYETPDNIVGHIPESSNPGETGNGWFFGHLESPIRGEGSVFRRLPEIPEMLMNGDEVYVILENEAGHAFLYRVSRTHVVHEDNIQLYDSEGATITLVACVPRLIYDHRILVTADLVGVKDG